MADAERVRYGAEQAETIGDIALYIPRDAERCPDCQCERGEHHAPGCDVEQCPHCRRQLIGCDHDSEVLP